MGGVVVGGIYNAFWWPYYALSVPPSYYDPYYQFPYPAPSSVIEVPPPEATTAYQEQPPTAYQQEPTAAMSPNQCYAPKMDQTGAMIMENRNPIPDFSKPVPCPPQQ
jgi:hypothetical protein